MIHDLHQTQPGITNNRCSRNTRIIPKPVKDQPDSTIAKLLRILPRHKTILSKNQKPRNKTWDASDRKKMLIWGAVGMAVSLLVMSIGMHFSSHNHVAAYICAIALTIYIAFFSATWGPVMWVMIGEVFPLNIRGIGNSFGAVINWSANSVVSLTFPFLLYLFGTGSLFFGNAAACVLGIWFVHSKVFETRNRSLEEIEDGLRKGNLKCESHKTK